MDRLTRSMMAGGLGLALVALTGCRTPHAEVPPGRPYSKDGQQRKAIEFSTDGHPVSGASSANFAPNMGGGMGPGVGLGGSGVGASASSGGAGLPGNVGLPGGAGMGPPTGPGLADPATSRASMPAPGPGLDGPPVGMPPLDSAPGASGSTGPALNVTPSRAPRPMPNEIIQSPDQAPPGQMGAPDQGPSPN